MTRYRAVDRLRACPSVGHPIKIRFRPGTHVQHQFHRNGLRRSAPVTHAHEVSERLTGDRDESWWRAALPDWTANEPSQEWPNGNRSFLLDCGMRVNAFMQTEHVALSGGDVIWVREIPSDRWDLAVGQLRDAGSLAVLDGEVQVGLHRNQSFPNADGRIHVTVFTAVNPQFLALLSPRPRSLPAGSHWSGR